MTEREIAQNRVAVNVFHSCDYPWRETEHHFGPDHVSSHDEGDADDGEIKIIWMVMSGVRQHPGLTCKWGRQC